VGDCPTPRVQFAKCYHKTRNLWSRAKGLENAELEDTWRESE
jgi:hypothetical protein